MNWAINKNNSVYIQRLLYLGLINDYFTAGSHSQTRSPPFAFQNILLFSVSRRRKTAPPRDLFQQPFQEVASSIQLNSTSRH